MVSDDDAIPEIFLKLTNKAIRSVHDLKSSIDVLTLERAVDPLDRAAALHAARDSGEITNHACDTDAEESV